MLREEWRSKQKRFSSYHQSTWELGTQIDPVKEELLPVLIHWFIPMNWNSDQHKPFVETRITDSIPQSWPQVSRSHHRWHPSIPHKFLWCVISQPGLNGKAIFSVPSIQDLQYLFPSYSSFFSILGFFFIGNPMSVQYISLDMYQNVYHATWESYDRNSPIFVDQREVYMQ